MKRLSREDFATVKLWNALELLKQTSNSALVSSVANSTSDMLSTSWSIADGVPEHDLADSSTVELVITLGGDGTVLHAAWLFQKVVPPLLSFHLGTLGFLTAFDFGNLEAVFDRVLLSEEAMPFRLGLRMRLSCCVYRSKTVRTPGLRRLEKSNSVESKPRADETFHILNDLVIDRGPSAYMSQLEVFGDERHLSDHASGASHAGQDQRGAEKA